MIRLDLSRVETEEAENEWSATFSDLITLVLCFFVVLTAIFAVKEGSTFEVAIDSLRGLGRAETEQPVFLQKQQAIEGIAFHLGELTEDSQYANNIEITERPDGIEIEINEKDGKSLFSSGSANLTVEAQRLIFDVVKRIVFPPSSLEYSTEEFREVMFHIISQIEIQGHTDNMPTGTQSKYPSNWELSLARANNVRLFLEHMNFPQELLKKTHVTGYANNKPAIFPELVPEDPNKTRTNRDRNRRLVIFLAIETG